jgi:Ca-activated chloride channel family protein
MVLVMDTSGSMRGPKMEQARKALQYCLNQLGQSDRFGLISFATTVNPYEEKLLDASPDQLKKARKWVDELEATGGTAINSALEAALKLRPADADRPFTVVFFTDGLPTIGVTDVEQIFKNVAARNTAHTRIFTFGVGDDVNAGLLDRLAENTRALSAYVRPEEDIANKVAGLYGKMSSPVLTNLKLTTTADVKFIDTYPPELPDLFHGEQLVVMGRYTGSGATAIKLTGKVGKETKEFVYELSMAERTDDAREFVEQLWARRKVGYLLDQIRLNGEKKELKDEVTALAKKYGITTPYTSYLIVPDVPLPGASPGTPGSGRPTAGGPGSAGRMVPPGLAPGGAGGASTDPSAAKTVLDLARKPADERAKLRAFYADKDVKEGAKRETDAEKGAAKPTSEAKPGGGKPGEGKSRGAYGYRAAEEKKDAYERARELLARRNLDGLAQGKTGVDYAVQNGQLRLQSQMDRSAVCQVWGRQCMEVGGVWIDEGFTARTNAVVVKAQSEAYFKLLAKHPQLKKVFALGNHLVWITPSGTALVIDAGSGKDKMSDDEVAKLFVAKK